MALTVQIASKWTQYVKNNVAASENNSNPIQITPLNDRVGLIKWKYIK